MAEVTRLPGPLAHLWEWQRLGSCRRAGADAFFHPEGERGNQRRARVAHAKLICSACPVVRQCLEHSLAAEEPYGIWGGLSEEERESYLARRRAMAAS
jgi:WhiB family redox-sensing transcriptional regulator